MLQLEVFMKFFVKLELPYSVIRGEQVLVDAVVFNFFDEDLEVNILHEWKAPFSFNSRLNYVSRHMFEPDLFYQKEERRAVICDIWLELQSKWNHYVVV